MHALPPNMLTKLNATPDPELWDYEPLLLVWTLLCTANPQFISRRVLKKDFWFIFASVSFYNRTLSMSILPKPLFSVRIKFSAHIFNTPRNWKRLIQEIKISRGKFKKATQIALRWLWRSWGLLRGDSSFYSALKLYLQQRGSAVWPLMELTEEEPHALSVQYHGLTESHNSSLLITSGARLVFAILNWQFLHLRKLTPPPLASSWTCLVLTVHFCVDRVLHCAHK